MSVPRQQVQRLRVANRALAVRMQRELGAAWRGLDLGRPAAARDELLRVAPVLTTRFGVMSAALSAEWYDEARDVASVGGSFRARPADPVAPQIVQSRTRFGAQHLFTLNQEQTLAFLGTALTEYALQPGRDTITQNTMRDPRAAGWERSVSANACDFCVMLSGRGGVYKEATAGFAAHGHCNCTASPSWDRNAPEVPVSAYVASERTDRMSEDERERHNERVREYVADMRN